MYSNEKNSFQKIKTTLASKIAAQWNKNFDMRNTFTWIAIILQQADIWKSANLDCDHFASWHLEKCQLGLRSSCKLTFGKCQSNAKVQWKSVIEKEKRNKNQVKSKRSVHASMNIQWKQRVENGEYTFWRLQIRVTCVRYYRLCIWKTHKCTQEVHTQLGPAPRKDLSLMATLS